MHPDTFHRYSSHRAACKLWGVALGVVIILVGVLGKLEAESLLAAALPLVLLGLVDAAYAGQERRCVEILKNRKGNDEFAGLLPEAAGAGVVRTGLAALSLSVWPFYLGLLGVAAAGKTVLTSRHEDADHRLVHAAAPGLAAAAKVAKVGCGSGGCGAAGGCGSGGCGASVGKSCSCGGGAKSAATPTQVKQYFRTTTGPMPPGPPRPGPGFAQPVRPPNNPNLPRVGPPLVQQPARPIPSGQTALPATAAPARIVPASGVAPSAEEPQ